MVSCGDCTLCCKVLGISDFPDGYKTPANSWCKYCEPAGAKCTIYEDRPKSCRTFECQWLMSQRSDIPMPDYMRPDRIKVMFDSTHDHRMAAFVDPGYPEAYKKVMPMLRAIAKKQRGVAVQIGDQYLIVDSNGKTYPAQVTKDEGNGRLTLERIE